MSGKGELEWMVPIITMLGSIDHKEVQACSICNVSPKLGEAKEEAFNPSFVSLGVLSKASSSRNNSRPLQLQLMELTKWRYTLSLLRQQGPISNEKTILKNCGVAILKLVVTLI